MDRAEAELLLSPRMLAAVDAEADAPAAGDAFARSAALRKAGFAPLEVAAILTQAALRRQAVKKFGPFADALLYTRAGLEQATRLDVAAQHAARFRGAGLGRVADLGCGLGGDALALAALGAGVLAVERDPVTAALARFNLAAFPEVEVRAADAESVDLRGVDGVWLDPARRTAGHTDTRRVRAEDYSPSLDFAAAVAERLPTGVKLSPAHDRATLPTGAEAQWVSHRGEVVELALWRGALARPGVGRAALLVTPAGTAELTAPADTPDEPPGPLGGYLHEPDGAAIRARLIGDLARGADARPVADGIAYLTGDAPAATPFLASFAIDAVLPFDRAAIRRELRGRGVGRLEIKKRGVDLDPAAYRRGLGLAGDGEAVLIVTRAQDRRVALVCSRVTATAAPA